MIKDAEMSISGEPLISEFASLKQAVEWVAFGLIPQFDNDDRFPPDDARIWLRTKDPNGDLAKSIQAAQQKIFSALKDGRLLATSLGITEIERDAR